MFLFSVINLGFCVYAACVEGGLFIQHAPENLAFPDFWGGASSTGILYEVSQNVNLALLAANQCKAEGLELYS